MKINFNFYTFKIKIIVIIIIFIDYSYILSKEKDDKSAIGNLNNFSDGLSMLFVNS